ncbi:MAG TPA: UPF0149 family protein [Rhodanobacteraceae bacterium]
MAATYTHASFEEALGQTTLGVGASELHGLLAGYVCGGGGAKGAYMLKALELESDDELAGTPLRALMEGATPWCRESLSGMHLGFAPLLPPDSRPLAERTDAMVEWTRGFLGGFGLSGARADALSEDGREVLRDLGTVATSQLTLDTSSDTSAEEDEGALQELIEFVRVGAMLLHTDVAHVAKVRAAGARKH